MPPERRPGRLIVSPRVVADSRPSGPTARRNSSGESGAHAGANVDYSTSTAVQERNLARLAPVPEPQDGGPVYNVRVAGLFSVQPTSKQREYMVATFPTLEHLRCDVRSCILGCEYTILFLEVIIGFGLEFCCTVPPSVLAAKIPTLVQKEAKQFKKVFHSLLQRARVWDLQVYAFESVLDDLSMDKDIAVMTDVVVRLCGHVFRSLEEFFMWQDL